MFWVLINIIKVKMCKVWRWWYDIVYFAFSEYFNVCFIISPLPETLSSPANQRPQKSIQFILLSGSGCLLLKILHSKKIEKVEDFFSRNHFHFSPAEQWECLYNHHQIFNKNGNIIQLDRLPLTLCYILPSDMEMRW